MSETILCDVESLYDYFVNQEPDHQSEIVTITPPFEIRKTSHFHSEDGTIHYYDIVDALTNEVLICDGELQKFNLLKDGRYQWIPDPATLSAHSLVLTADQFEQFGIPLKLIKEDEDYSTYTVVIDSK